MKIKLTMINFKDSCKSFFFFITWRLRCAYSQNLNFGHWCFMWAHLEKCMNPNFPVPWPLLVTMNSSYCCKGGERRLSWHDCTYKNQKCCTVKTVQSMWNQKSQAGIEFGKMLQFITETAVSLAVDEVTKDKKCRNS